MLTTRELRLEELDDCVRLFIKVFSEEPWNDRWPSFEKARGYVSDLTQAPGFRGYVAERDGVLVALCLGNKRRWWQGDEFFIHEMGVDPDAQRVGIGSQLIRYAVAQLRAEGVDYVALLTERGVPAERFWHKQDFDQAEDTILMFRYLNE